jgi:type I restriction enzyme, S subunit
VLGILGLDSLSEDVGVPGLSREKAYGTRLPLPSLTTQRAIADYLDAETTRVDAIIEKKQRLIELLNERAGVITAGLSSGMTSLEDSTSVGLESSDRVASGVDWILTMPSDWRRYPLKYYFRFSKGKDAQRLTHEYVQANPGDYPVYSGQTTTGGTFGSIDTYDFDLPTGAILVSTGRQSHDVEACPW